MKLDLYVVMGGKSTEHEVSIKSALNVLTCANREKYNVYGLYIDRDGLFAVFEVPENITAPALLSLCQHTEGAHITAVISKYFNDNKNKIFFPVIHGNFGEDGTLQGLFEYLDIPYVGCPVAASAVGMDKAVMKLVAKALAIPMADYVCIDYIPYCNDREKYLNEAVVRLGFPLFVKPSNGGSSVGINSAYNIEELKKAVEEAFRYDKRLLIEQLVTGREIEIGVLGNYEVQCQSGEFVRNPSFFDYHAKYLDDNLQMKIPADVPAVAYEKMKTYAIRMFNEIGGLGLSRVDFFYTDNGEILFNEINTLPGFTAVSMYPSLWQVTEGMDTGQLVDKLIQLGLNVYEEKCRLRKAEIQ